MKTMWLSVVSLVFVVILSCSATLVQAGEKEDAVNMVKDAVAFYKTNGM